MRSTRAIIHTENFRHNIRLVRERIGSRRLICAAVKADAYGHGSVEMSRIAIEEGVNFLAVATVGEGVKLRENGILHPVLLLTLTHPDEFEIIIKNDIQPLVADAGYVRSLSEEAVSQGKTVAVHLHVDTGMGRIGCPPGEASRLAEFISDLKGTELAGVSTHFACADSADRSFTESQLKRFKEAIEKIRETGIDPGIVHASNSAGILEYPESWMDMVRPGIMLYGYYPGNETDRSLPLKPVMELKTKIVFIKDVPGGRSLSYGATYTTKESTRVATIPVGYGDGYNRLLSSKGPVVIRGRKYTISGRVCMDQCMIDLGADSNACLYDDVILFGPGGPPSPSAEDIAELTGTIPYEITCSISGRVPRVYI